MTQGQWMKGCPEGGEQAFLFALYSQLSDGDCPCPNKCGYTMPRAKKDFFALYVRLLATFFFILESVELIQLLVRICYLHQAITADYSGTLSRL
jgi:hypothetical protein